MQWRAGSALPFGGCRWCSRAQGRSLAHAGVNLVSVLIASGADLELVGAAGLIVLRAARGAAVVFGVAIQDIFALELIALRAL